MARRSTRQEQQGQQEQTQAEEQLKKEVLARLLATADIGSDDSYQKAWERGKTWAQRIATFWQLRRLAKFPAAVTTLGLLPRYRDGLFVWSYQFLSYFQLLTADSLECPGPFFRGIAVGLWDIIHHDFDNLSDHAVGIEEVNAYWNHALGLAADDNGALYIENLAYAYGFVCGAISVWDELDLDSEEVVEKSIEAEAEAEAS